MRGERGGIPVMVSDEVMILKIPYHKEPTRVAHSFGQSARACASFVCHYRDASEVRVFSSFWPNLYLSKAFFAEKAPLFGKNEMLKAEK